MTRIQLAPSAARLSAPTHLANEGALRVEIDRRFTLDTMTEGLSYVERGHTRGKVVAEI